MNLPCIDVQPLGTDKPSAWTPCNFVHLRIRLRVFHTNPCIVGFGQALSELFS